MRMARPVQSRFTSRRPCLIGGTTQRPGNATVAIAGGEAVSLHQLPPRTPTFDVDRRYVRYRELDARGYVQFDFAIGDPELAVELVLPLPAYQEFCRTQAVTYLTRAQGEVIDFEKSKWRFGAPGQEN